MKIQNLTKYGGYNALMCGKVIFFVGKDNDQEYFKISEIHKNDEILYKFEAMDRIVFFFDNLLETIKYIMKYKTTFDFDIFEIFDTANNIRIKDTELYFDINAYFYWDISDILLMKDFILIKNEFENNGLFFVKINKSILKEKRQSIYVIPEYIYKKFHRRLTLLNF